MSASSLLCLQWGNHKEALTYRLNNLRSEDVFCDATIACNGKFFSVHRIVLSCCSEYFEEIFKNTPCRHPYVILKDIQISSIEYMLEFIYKGNVKIPENNLQSFLKAAETLKIKGLAAPDIPISGKDVSTGANSENNESQIAISAEECETELQATESTSASNLTSNQDGSNSIKESEGRPKKCSKKQSKHQRKEELIDKRRCLRSNKKIADNSQKSPVIKKKSNEGLKSPQKKTPTKIKQSLDSPNSETKKKNKDSTKSSEMNKKKKNETTNNQTAEQECFILPESTVTFTGKQEPEDEVEDTSLTTSWKHSYENTTHIGSPKKQAADNVPELPISEDQMKVDVDEFFDDPNDGGYRLKFTDDIIPLQYQIPDVHIGAAIGSSLSEIEGSSTSDYATNKVPPMNSIKVAQNSSESLEENESENVTMESNEASTQDITEHGNIDNTFGLLTNLVTSLRGEKDPIELEKPFACYICPYRTKYRSALISHVIVHTGAKPFKCSQCSYETGRKNHLKVHELTHTSVKPYTCEICSKSFTQKSNYKVHKWIHLKRKPFTCHLCSYATNNNASLTRHLRIHEGRVPFKCDLCSFGAQASGDLKKHYRTHTGEKPFSCPHCHYKAAVKTSLKQHIAKYHKDSAL